MHLQKFIRHTTQRAHHFESTSIPRGYYVVSSKSKFRQNSTSFMHFFDVISLIEKSTSFPRTFFSVISLFEISTMFPRTFFDVISMVEKPTLFPPTFFDAILMVENSTLFARTFSEEISTHIYVVMDIARARSLVVSNLRSETKGSRFQSGC